MSLRRLRRRFPWPSERPTVSVNPHGWLEEGTAALLAEACPGKLVLELGAWLGKSTRHIIDSGASAVISVDHWDPDKLMPWAQAKHPKLVPVIPVVYETFLANCWDRKYRNRLIPMRMDTRDALRALSQLNVEPHVIFLDSSHEYEHTCEELGLIDELFPSAVVVGDDWNWNERKWYPVRRAVCEKLGSRTLRAAGNGWRTDP